MEDQKMAKKPHEVRIGRIKATIWENETPAGVRHNVTFSRLYKAEGDSEWSSADSFGRDDLLVLRKVADRVNDYIVDQKRDAE
jgi:hypothetical protein